ncbi:MAG: hypothetical protein ACHQ0Y_05000 [Thermodesulfovibrionales bacterium]
MPYYFVKVIAMGGKNEEFELGQTTISAGTKKEAGAQGIQELWDPRLDAADCTPRAEVAPSTFDRYQRFVLANYSDGEGSYITKKKELQTYGDGLLAFLVREISESEGCESGDEALRRLAVVEAQISELHAAFAADFREQEEVV